MSRLLQSQLPDLTSPSAFLWATGIEDTFITEPWPGSGRTLDEYELTGHYASWHDDIGLIAELGVGAARYGIPWHRVQPRRDAWEPDFADRALDRLLALGIEPIVDLVHYGLPPWIEGAWLHPDLPRYLADYAARLAERFRGRVSAYTPVNEPRVTAWYCGRLGWWPPHRRGWSGFVAVMLSACRAIVETVRALRAVDRDLLVVHVDATDLYETDDPALEQEVLRRQQIVFLALDLVSGRVGSRHELWRWLLAHGAREQDLAWFETRAIELPLIGLNLYPMFTWKTAHRTSSGRLRWTMPYAGARILEALAPMYWRRYGRPLIVSETASVGPLARRRRWLRDSVAAVAGLRGRGVPVVGYTWWPLFALVAWAYRQGKRPPSDYLRQMGLWDLDADLRRVRTPLVDDYGALVARGAGAAGELAAAGAGAAEAVAR